MALDNDKPEGGENTQNQESLENDSSALMKAEIESLRSQQVEMINAMKGIQSYFSDKNKSESKPMTKEEFSELLTKDPETAIKYALKSNVDSQTQAIEHRLTQKQQQTYYDQKANQDFPMITKDKNFQSMVRAETKALIEAGMSPESPQLVYKAAEIVALKSKGAEDSKDKKNGSSGEAPSSIKKPTSSKAPSSNFEYMSKMFGLSDKAKEKAKANIEYQQEVSQRRNRG